jgi:hypothetical protein
MISLRMKSGMAVPVNNLSLYYRNGDNSCGTRELRKPKSSARLVGATPLKRALMHVPGTVQTSGPRLYLPIQGPESA